MMRKFYEWFFGPDPIIEEVDEQPEPDIQYMTYLYGCGVEEGEWITHWEERA